MSLLCHLTVFLWKCCFVVSIISIMHILRAGYWPGFFAAPENNNLDVMKTSPQPWIYLRFPWQILLFLNLSRIDMGLNECKSRYVFPGQSMVSFWWAHSATQVRDASDRVYFSIFSTSRPQSDEPNIMAWWRSWLPLCLEVPQVQT